MHGKRVSPPTPNADQMVWSKPVGGGSIDAHSQYHRWTSSNGLSNSNTNVYAQGGTSPESYRCSNLRPAREDLVAVSWNVEGLTLEKLETLQYYMAQAGVDLLCMQETHTCKSDYYISDQGFLVILSGPPSDTHDSAGVGFLVAPKLRDNNRAMQMFQVAKTQREREA